jgi:hypothetical protein
MSCRPQDLDASLQASLVALLAPPNGAGLKRIKSRTYAAQTVTFETQGEVKCINPSAQGTFTGRRLDVPVNNAGTGAAAN